ncbi:MAG: hypothetical protein ABL931_10505 [Usitatibacteraceae bacterium]
MSLPLKASLPLLFVSGAAFADDAALLRCRAITESTARLACYDALVVMPPGAVSAAKAPVRQSAPTPAAPAKQSASQFGLEQRQALKTELDAIESSIVGSFEGWRANSNIRLANGQVWQIADDTSRAHYVDNPKVRIRRGALGSFYLEIEGTNHSPRVRRVQ